MLKTFQFFFPETLCAVNSPVNGEIKVVEQFGKRSIRVAGIEQSGPMVEKIWEKTISKSGELGNTVKNCLILGLGGGSAVKALNKYYPGIKIVGVEIDPVMIKLGKKYLGLKKGNNLKIKIADATDLNNIYYLSKFNLVLVDVYTGKNIPKEMENEEFLRSLAKILSAGGRIIFNRLCGNKRKKEIDSFFRKLKNNFSEVTVVKPLANQLFIVRVN